MSWTILAILVAILTTSYLVLLLRRMELQTMARAIDERSRARKAGTDRPRLQHPQIDLTRCLGCAACVRACPEKGVLDLIHGQAAVVHGANCVGHGHCQEACPSAAISVSLADLGERRDLPALTRSCQAVGLPGLFLPGEITGHSLIRSAIEQGRTVARAALDHCRDRGLETANGTCDLVVVGAGPAGLACAVEAQERGLRVEVIEQGTFGGAVARFPRRKLVLTRPVHLPGWGQLEHESYTREELLEIWENIAKERELVVNGNVRFEGLKQEADGSWRLSTNRGEWKAPCVCLALGRRGSPARLQVPGEDLPKVQSSLIDARAYHRRRILVVGGGDSALETALALSLQPDNEITISYRKGSFSRPCARNRRNLEDAVEAGRIQLELETQVREITPEWVHLQYVNGRGEGSLRLANDDVFVAIGGTTPVPLLESCGVSFDPLDRQGGEDSLGGHVPHVERKQLIRSLSAALVLTVLGLGWAIYHSEFYRLSVAERPLSDAYELLRPAGAVGLGLGIAAALMVLANLAYLLRRTDWIPLRLGRLRSWMTVHIVTGILALSLAFLHGGMRLGDTLGGHAALALCVLVVTGAVGRYLYSFIPRTTSGRDLEHEEVREELRRFSGELDESAGDFARLIREFAREQTTSNYWKGGFVRRLWGLLSSRAQLRRSLRELEDSARAAGRDEAQIRQLSMLVVRAQRSAQSAEHFEDLRGMLSSWRHLHGWLALLLVLILAAHIWDALRYGNLIEW